MHHSLHIRDQLRRYRQDPIWQPRRDPHRGVCRDPQAQPGSGEWMLHGAWSLDCRVDQDVDAALRSDLADFLGRMGVGVSDAGDQRLAVRLNPSLNERDCRLSLHPGSIVLEGGGVSGVWAAVAWLEWEMRTRRGPIVRESDQTYRAAWPVQISPGPAGGHYSVPDFSTEFLDDDAFRLYAHYGITSMMIYGELLCYVRSRILPELNHPDYDHHMQMLRDAARRAARYGVRLTYVPVCPKLRPDHAVFRAHPSTRGSGTDRAGKDRTFHFLCSSEPAVLDFYDETFANLFREVPELAGVILITFCESFYHCRVWGGLSEPCPTCTERPIAQMVGNLIGTVQRAVVRSQPRAFTAMWMYSNAWTHGDKVEFYRQMPADTAIFYHVDKDTIQQRDGYKKLHWDYSLACTGPNPTMAQLAKEARATGRSLMVKTETATGAEFMPFPYVPAMGQLADKWQVVRSLQPCGVHQSWLFFGMFGSRAEELGLWAAYRPDMPSEAFLQQMACRDFGPSCVEAVTEAWSALSRAVRLLPMLVFPNYYVGPSFLGPAHPLVPHADDTVPDIFFGRLFYLQELAESFSTGQADRDRICMAMRDLPVYARDLYIYPDQVTDYGWELVIRDYARAAEEAKSAWTLLRGAMDQVRTRQDADNLREESLVVELIYRVMLSCEHTARFLLARRYDHESGEKRFRHEMCDIARRERDNALAARPIYVELPWLDLSKRIDGVFHSSIDMIDVKARWIEDAFPCRTVVAAE
ncbi:MAG: hypothetical protein IT440_12115 [Phycisphaeraceae bacterium]|nr:hypothetical protein [Phycisphaeraceae bacterium]